MSVCSITDPPWLLVARTDIGLREIAGQRTAPRIHQWLSELGAWWRDDEAPWCGVAMGAWMDRAGVPIPSAYYRARAWLDWGHQIHEPIVGAVVVFERTGGGHVALIEGVNAAGDLMCLGGNQGNAVSVAPFQRSRVLGYRWPVEYLYMLRAGELPLIASTTARSNNEV